jgi:hypothetical protein
LQAANNALSSIADPTTGTLATEFNNQTSLSAQLSTADAAVAVFQE